MYRRVCSTAAALAGGLALAVGGVAAPALAAPAAAATGTVITAVQGPFGPMLVVGSGRYRGYTLYFISSDNSPTRYGCTPRVVTVLGSPLARRPRRGTAHRRGDDSPARSASKRPGSVVGPRDAGTVTGAAARQA